MLVELSETDLVNLIRALDAVTKSGGLEASKITLPLSLKLDEAFKSNKKGDELEAKPADGK